MFIIDDIEIWYEVKYIQWDIILQANCTKWYIGKTKELLLEKYEQIKKI
jgi:hypothetical protein